MPVGGGRRIDRAQQVQVADDGTGAQVEYLADGLLDLDRVFRLGTERLDEQADGCRFTDGVGHLHLDPFSQPGGDDILGHPAHRVRRRPVHLGRILAGEGAAAVAGPAAVGVDDDLAAGEPGIAHRPAEHELAGRVHQHPHRRRVQGFVGQVVEHGVEHLFPDVGIKRLLQVDIGRVLGGDDHGIQPHRNVVLVGDSDLRLAIRTQVGQHPVLADLGQPPRQSVGQRDGQWHQFRGGIDRAAEHQALVTGALGVQRIGRALDPGLVGGVDPLGDVG